MEIVKDVTAHYYQKVFTMIFEFDDILALKLVD